MSSRVLRLIVPVPACTLAASLLVAAQAPPPAASRTARDGVYSDEQARRGQAVYKDKCASCHGAALAGANAPPLAGDAFQSIWGGPLSDLVNKIQNTMPQDAPGKLTRQQSTDVLAYMLQVGRFPAGRSELSADETAQKTIAVAAAAAPRSAAAAAAAQTPAFPAAGNLNQVMRGILFPSSNLIFNVQLHDPGAPEPARPANQPANQPANDSFSTVAWGSGIYKGWDIIDYAAIAIAESAPLMLTPGRRCENGRPVPVTDPEWIKYTLELAEVGRAAYKASQTRNQEVVSEVTNQIAEACLNCHQVYREKRGRNANPVDVTGQSARCTK